MEYVLNVMRRMDMVDQIVQQIIVDQIESHLVTRMVRVVVRQDGKMMD